MSPTLEDLPAALLARHVCAFLDAASLARLELGGGRELRACVRGSGLWAAQVARRFGLTDLPRLGLSAADGGECQAAAASGWKRVFAAAQQDARALAAAAECQAAVRVCRDRRPALALALGPQELTVRDELALMQALRRFPASDALVQLYARWLRASQRGSSSSSSSLSSSSLAARRP